MSDMQKVIEPKSDQWNFDDFQTGPRTFTIKSVKVRHGQDQPVEMTLEGTEKYYRPCKSMARVIVAAWGADSSKYTGKSMTLYGDASVKWGGMAVGGIRISHMSHMEENMTMALTATRGSKKPYTVKPLVVSASPDFATALKSAASMDELGKAWSAIPKAEQKKYVAIKDARKAELSAPPADSLSARIAACATVADLDALSETLDEETAAIFFDTIVKRKTELTEGGGL